MSSHEASRQWAHQWGQPASGGGFLESASLDAGVWRGLSGSPGKDLSAGAWWFGLGC